MEGIILQPGAFNPVHRMHLKIADDAKKRFPNHFHGFILSSHTCDKGIIPTEELLRRRRLIMDQGKYNAFITESGLFVDHIKMLRESTELPIVFAVGEDTLYRFFRDWDEYYKDVEGIDKLAEYREMFKNVLWYVSRRNCPALMEYVRLLEKYKKALDNIVWSDLDLDSISSTEIRKNNEEREKEYGGT